MSVSVRFTCNGATRSTSQLRRALGAPCPAYVAVALDVSAFADGLVFDATRQLWIVETEWHDVPEGWRIHADGTALCPDHQ